jgi:hypothetical protein
MQGAPVLFFLLVFAAVAVGVWIIAPQLDRKRIDAYLHQRGARLLESSWQPFGLGWFGDKSDRIYRVRYIDRDGAVHDASCKTSMLSGVYFSDDVIDVRTQARDDSASELEQLRAENARLKREIANKDEHS